MEINPYDLSDWDDSFQISPDFEDLPLFDVEETLAFLEWLPDDCKASYGPYISTIVDDETIELKFEEFKRERGNRC